MTYTTTWGDTCDAWVLNPHGPARKKCSNSATHKLAGVTFLCMKHMNMVVDQIEDLIDSNQKDRLADYERVIEDCRRFHGPDGRANLMNTPQAQEMFAEMAKNAPPEPARYVYFIECEDFVKIGLSTNPTSRLKALQVSGNGTYAPKLIDLTTARIIATEPGGPKRERELHQQFDASRHTGEWFTKTPELLAHIHALMDRELLAK